MCQGRAQSASQHPQTRSAEKGTMMEGINGDDDSCSHVQEEDASSITLWSANYARHEARTIQLTRDLSVGMECVTTLSPLDMVALSQGSHDATGHRLWSGACFFVASLISGALRLETEGKTVLELGCGTGLAGICLGVIAAHNKKVPNVIVLSDGDDSALDLCRKNCVRNFGNDHPFITTEKLVWGQGKAVGVFDYVIATDVIYDFGCLEPFLRTVNDNTEEKSGILILVHVPRASLPDESQVASAERLEGFIEDQAHRHGFFLSRIIRAKDVKETIEFLEWDEDPETAEAAIMIFHKTTDADALSATATAPDHRQE